MKMWKNKKISTIKWSDFFEVTPNNYKTYRLIPHLNMSNSQNRHMWNALHKAYELYHSFQSRLEWVQKDGMKVTFRPKDYIWFDMIMKNTNEGKKIEFYFTTTETMADKMKGIVENRWRTTVEEVSSDSLHVNFKNTDVYEMKYAHHDIFSLNTNHQLQNTPIGTLLNTIDEMEEGDFARISICNERESREKWLGNSSWALKKISKGYIPKRPNAGGKRLMGAISKAFVAIANEVLHLLKDVLNAFNNVFSPNSKAFDNKEIQHKNELQEDIQTLKISERTKEKANASVWRSHIRVAVSSERKFNRDNIGNALTSAYSELNENNELKVSKLKFGGFETNIRGKDIKIKGRKHEIIEELNTFQLSKRTKTDINPNLISCDELGRFIQLPTADLQRRFDDYIKTNKKVETDIPSIFIHKNTEEHVKIDGIKVSIGSNNIKSNGKKKRKTSAKQNGILIGHSEHKANNFPISIPVTNPEEFYKGYVYLGGMGGGKDTAIQNFVTEGSLNHGLSFFVIDQVNKEGLQGMANGIRDTLPPDKIIDIDLSDENYLPPLDLTEVMKKLGRKGEDRFANELIDFFGDIEGMGQSRKILRDFAKASNGNLYNIKRLIEDEDFREETAKRLREEKKIRLAEEIEKFISQYELVIKRDKDGNEKSREYKCTRDGQKAIDSKAQPILNRLDEFFGDNTLFEIFAQPPKEELNFEKWMKEGKVVIFRVPDRILSTVAVRTLVHWITLKVLMTRLLMQTEDQSNGAFMIFNEPQTYLSGNDGLAKLLARIAVQGRKERLGSIFACHYLGQIKEIEKDLISGGVHWMLFKSDNEETFKKLEKELKPIDVETALNIPNTKDTRHAICILNFGGERKPAFMVQMLKPSYKRYEPYNNSFLTQRHSRMYGRHWEEIESLLEGA
ncbi:ATP-binding protein [Sutcliffiella sp. NC1]|uniref:ATP-binding protein n=1 Tax=Sutcliffiella sp. NC1 TaxID=3004096 RepID=UPI0022DDC542|nr:ATP-binding protein [Sutcliffiella sp. NC1]WBL16390.1 ATP-binding protein [Sutcliffiella sp. NC1]